MRAFLSGAVLGTVTGAGLQHATARRLTTRRQRTLTTATTSARVPPPTPLPPVPAAPVRVALCQLAVGADKQQNLDGAEAAIRSAASKGAQLVTQNPSWL